MPSEPHNSTKPAAPSWSISNIPIKHEGHVIGVGELKDWVLTIELNDNLYAQMIGDGLLCGLVEGLSIETIKILAFNNQTRMEI